MPNKEGDFLLAIKSGKSSFEPLETVHYTISMCQLRLIAVKTGAKLIRNPAKEDIIYLYSDQEVFQILKIV